MVISTDDYWNTKLSSSEMAQLIHDYVIDKLSTKDLVKKYHSSINRVIAVLEKAGVKRSRVSAINEKNLRYNNNLQWISKIDEETLNNFAKLGISWKYFLRLLGLADGSKVVKSINGKDNFIKISNGVRHKKHKINAQAKIEYLYSLDALTWESLCLNYSAKELVKMFKVSSSFIYTLLDKNGLNNEWDSKKGLELHISQSDLGNKVSRWVYSAMRSKEILQHVINSFSPVTSKDLATFFGTSTSQANFVIKRLGIEVSPRSTYGSLYEERVYNELRTFYNRPINRWNRQILNGRELDFYLPEDKLAIEVSPSETHATGGKTNILNYVDSQYHFRKREECNTLGIQLITLSDPELSDKFLCKDIRLMLKQYLQVNPLKIGSNLKAKQVSRDIGESYVNRYHEYTFGSNISDCVGIFDDNKMIAIALLGKYKQYSLNKAIKIIDIYSDYVLPLHSCIMDSLVKFIEDTYSQGTQIYAETSYWHGTGRFYLENGFQLVKSMKSRKIFVRTKNKGTVPLSENIMKHYSTNELFNRGYNSMQNCGAKLFKYVGIKVK